MPQNQDQIQDIICQNGAMSFVKARGDWLNIDKIHLSFVQHTGLKNGCKQVSAIEAALPIYRAAGKLAGNNQPEDNVSGLQKLDYMVHNGSLFSRLKASRAAALKKSNGNGDIYCESVFEYIGGSAAKVKNGQQIPIRYRKISVSPAAFKPNQENTNLILEAFECDGGTTTTGGFVPLKGFPNKTQIRVMFKPAEFVVFVESMMNAWKAELVRRAICGEQQFYRWHDHHNKNEEEPKQSVSPPASPQPTVKKVSIIVAYDTAGALFVAATKERFVDTLREGLKQMLDTKQQWVLPKSEADKVLTAVSADEKIPTVTAHSKTDKEMSDYLNFRRVNISVTV